MSNVGRYKKMKNYSLKIGPAIRNKRVWKIHFERNKSCSGKMITDPGKANRNLL